MLQGDGDFSASGRLELYRRRGCVRRLAGKARLDGKSGLDGKSFEEGKFSIVYCGRILLV